MHLATLLWLTILDNCDVNILTHINFLSTHIMAWSSWNILILLSRVPDYFTTLYGIDDNGLIIKDRTRLLIPEGMRTRWIDYLRYKTCVERSPSNPSDQIKPHEPAVYPFQRIHADLGNYGRKQWIIITVKQKQCCQMHLKHRYIWISIISFFFLFLFKLY